MDKKLQVAKQVFELVGAADLDRGIDAMLSQVREDDPDMAKKLGDRMKQHKDRLMAYGAEQYAKAFSLEELRAMLAFHGSPVGRSITSKTPGVLAEVSKFLPGFIQEIMRD